MVQSGRAASGYTSERGTFYSNIHKHRNGGYFVALCVYAVHAAAVVEGRTGYKQLGSQAALLALLLSAAVLLLNGAKRKGTKSIPTYDIDGKESSGTNLITTLTANATARQPALVKNLKND